MLTDMSINDVHEGYLTELGEIDGIQTVCDGEDQARAQRYNEV
jgi:hypothetical protein